METKHVSRILRTQERTALQMCTGLLFGEFSKRPPGVLAAGRRNWQPGPLRTEIHGEFPRLLTVPRANEPGSAGVSPAS